MLNLICRLSLNVARTGSIRKAAFQQIRRERIPWDRQVCWTIRRLSLDVSRTGTIRKAAFQQIQRERIPWDRQVCWMWFVGSVSTFWELGQLVKRPFYAQRKRVISWLISMIVKLTHSWNKQEGYPGWYQWSSNSLTVGTSKRDKSEGVDNDNFKVKVVNFSNLWALWLDYSKVHATLNWQERLLRWRFKVPSHLNYGYNWVLSALKSFGRTGSVH